MALFWYSAFGLFSTLIDLMLIKRLPVHEKETELLLLLQQLAILERRQNNQVKLSKSEKLTLAVLTVKLRMLSRRTAPIER